MQLRQYTEPGDFLYFLETMFSKPYENELMIGLVSILIKNPSYYNTNPIMAIITKETRNPLALFITPPWPLILYAENTPKTRTIQSVIAFLTEQNITVSGVNAKKPLSSFFSEQWCQQKKCESQPKMTMNFFMLQHTNPIPACSGHCIRATKQHFNLLYTWAKQFHKDLNLQYETDDYIKTHVNQIIQSKNAFLWIDQETPVSMIFRERPHKKGVSIGYVYTPKKDRSKGYATKLVHRVCVQSLKQGFSYISLFADADNPVSNHIYTKIGFNKICTYQIYDFMP